MAGALPDSGGAAALTVADAASRVEVRTVDLPGLLYRVTTPYRSGLAPRVTGPAARLTLRLGPTGDDGPDAVLILLNRAVRWQIRLPAGGGEEHLELSRGRLTALEVGAAGLVRVRLPAPVGLVGVTVLSGVGAVEFTAPLATAVRLHLRGGAGEAFVPWGAPHGGVAMSPGWGVRANRYAIETRGGVGSVRVFAPGPWR
ncbi:MAG: hypothetical protein QOH97_2374 [Actinoplanes sp.]|nr:hypothetical protein [Actinoplanes sp.]